ncbi:MAG: sigma 54-interacting transcriptional regulator, partial [Longimicrobiales bacterium]
MDSLRRRVQRLFRLLTAAHTNSHVSTRAAGRWVNKTDRMLSLVLIARRADYFSMVAGIAARCGAKPLWLRSGSEVQRLKGQCGVALLELEARSDGHDEATLACIAGLKTAGWSIFCYAPALRDWPIGMQCRPLLAGASRSLDSNVAGFEEELARRIEEQLQLCASSQGDRARLRQIMALRGIAGVSQSILDVFQWLVRVAPLSDLPVLITGETGTGKELFAHAVHTLDGKRCRGPFVAVNCGAISEGIAESELFGHRRGAFTGADRDRPGLFRAAQGGVLFLDEVGELSESVQSKLLRVLQDRRVLAVGDEKDASVNVRVIAATHRDLAERVAQGAFRADLFHRLTVLTLRVPPLRERREDMGPLIEHFLAQYGELVLGRPVSATTEFVQAISQLELPGNVRELENILRRILVCRTEGSA